MAEWLQTFAPFEGLALALALGLLIGVERGWSHRLEEDGSRVAGIRTFALLGLTGGLAGEAGRLGSPMLAVVLAAAAALALLIGYARSAREGQVSATSTIVGVITLGVGVFATTGQGVTAAAVAAVTTLVLSMRRQLHQWVGELTEAELHAIARFGLISLAILPVLPDDSFGPYGVWNPRQIWMIVVLVSGLSLAGYAASRRLGASRGVLAMAAAGALVSSTAVTASLAARAQKGEIAPQMLTAGVALASSVMLARALVLVGLLAPPALPALATAMVPAILVGLAWTAWAVRRAGMGKAAEPSKSSLRNPFDIAPALLLAGLIMALSLIGRWALETFGDAGLITVLAISGMVDVDSGIITASRSPSAGMGGITAGLIFIAPVMMNTLVKAGLTVSIARRVGWSAAAALLLSVVAGLAGALVAPLLFGR